MARVSNTFIGGRMDSDTHYSLMDNKLYVLAENMRLHGVGEDGAFKFLKGSKNVSDLSENRTMRVVGMYEGHNNKMYYFLAHTNGKSKIVEYDQETKQSKVIISDSSILRFDQIRWENGVEKVPYKYLLGIDQIGDLLFFSDAVWKYPRVVNIKRDYSAGFSAEDIIVAKKPPKDAPKILDWQNNNFDNDDNDVFVSFAYRYKYLDGDYSALSFYSETAFEPNGSLAVNAQRENTGMINKWDEVRLMIESGGSSVTDIEVYAREHKSNTAYLIYSVNKKQSAIADNTPIYDVTYKFSKNYQVLNEEDTKLLFSNVPHYPVTQTVAGNRLLYGNYTEGFDLKDSSDTPITIDYQVSKYQTEYDTDYKRNTAVSMFKYKVGVVFYNDYNESTTVLLPTDQSKSEVEITFADRLKNNHLRVEMQPNSIPQGFTKMKFVVNSQDLNYDTLYITYAKKIGNRVYLYLTNDNVNRVKKGDIITRVDADVNDKYDYTVIEVKQYDIDDGMSLKGVYAYFEIDEDDTFTLVSNGTNVSKTHQMSEKQIDTVNGSSNINRYDATSGYEGTGMSGVPYSSKWNRGTVLISDYGFIKEGDVFKYNIDFRYGRDKKGAGTNSTDWYGSVVIKEEIYAPQDYTDVYEFLKDNLTNAFLTVQKSGNEVWLMTNSNFTDLVKENVPLIWDWHVNNAGSREERAVVAVKTTTNIQRGIEPLIFRTKNNEVLNEFYFETEKTYKIINGAVVPDSLNGANPVFDIGFYNGYCFGDGVESYKIKDVFNAKELQYKFRGSLYEKNGYKQIQRKYDITYSGIYNHEMGINNLSVFNPSTANWKTLPIKYGEINHIVGTRGDVAVYFENGIGNVMYGKSILFDLMSTENVATTNDVLGNFIEVSDYYGCNEPESVVKSPYGNFLVDKRRNRILLHSDRQIQELNAVQSGFHNKGVKLLKNNHSFLSSFDNVNGEYIVGYNEKGSIRFSLPLKGFTTYNTQCFDYIIGSSGSHYTAYRGVIYENEVTDDYNNLSGQGGQRAKLVYIVNPEIDSDKIYKAMYLQSNTGWDTHIKSNLTESYIPEDAYVQKESFYYSDIFRDISDTYHQCGIGVIQSIDGNVITFKNPITNEVAVGDFLYTEESGMETKIEDINANIITVEDGSNLSEQSFAIANKQYDGYYRADGSPVRGKWMEVTLTKTGNEPYYINTVFTEVIKSWL